MPLYEVEYGCSLTRAQKQALANAITKLHHETYHVPSFFVAVKFTDGSENDNYSGGKEVTVNRIFATVRTGGARTAQDFDNLCSKLVNIWNTVIFGRDSEEASKPGPRRLNGVFVLRSIDASWEEGGMLPHTGPGEDEKWMRESLGGWQKRVTEGDDDFRSVVKDVESVLSGTAEL